MSRSTVLKAGMGLGLLGVAVFLVQLWMIFYWVPTEQSMGIVQRIFYVHVPSAWIGFTAFAISALCSAVYLWLRDERLDMAAVSAAEGGFVFLTVVLISGPLWGKIAWGTYWTWEPRLTFTLLLWFIFLGYFQVRSSVEGGERARRLSAVVAIVGALNIPIIHLSVELFRSLHPQPVVLKPDGPTLHPSMLWTLMTGVLAAHLVFFGFFFLRYALERERERRHAR